MLQTFWIMKILFLKKVTWKAVAMLLFLDFIKLLYFPRIDLIYWGLSFMLLDLVTGIIRSLSQNRFVFSEGIRKTLKKIFQYVGLVVLLAMLSNVIVQHPESARQTANMLGVGFTDKLVTTVKYINNLVLLLIIYSESLSICENIVGVDPQSWISKWVIKPIYTIISLAFTKNPFKRVHDELISQAKDKK